MSWFKLDDQGAFHSKVLAVGNEAYGAWCRAGQWCSQQLTDGRLSRAVAVTIGPWRLWLKLIEAGLIEDIGKGELQIHDFLVYNPSGEDVLAGRARKASNLAAYRKRKRPHVTALVTVPVTDHVTGYTPGNQDGSKPGRNHGPDPDPYPREEERERASAPHAPKSPKANRGAQLPADWAPTEQDHAFASARGWDKARVAEEAIRFRAWHESHGTISKTWAASWRTWVMNGRDRDRQRPPASGTHPAARHQPIIQRGAEQPWLPKAKETA